VRDSVKESAGLDGVIASDPQGERLRDVPEKGALRPDHCGRGVGIFTILSERGSDSTRKPIDSKSIKQRRKC